MTATPRSPASVVRKRWLFSFALLILAQDLWLAERGAAWGVRLAPALVFILAQWRWSGAGAAGLGLRVRPACGWVYWLKFGSLAGLVLGLCVVALQLASSPWKPQISSAGWGEQMLQACLLAPVVEEALYRLALCSAAAAFLGKGGAVALSGASFAALHFVYGNPGPENVLGGFVLAWAYLHSGSFLVPLLLHAGGNFLLILLWACWSFLA